MNEERNEGFEQLREEGDGYERSGEKKVVVERWKG